MILNTLMGFAFLFLVSWLLINPQAKNKITDAKGEFLINVTWPDESSDDVDTWVANSAGQVVWFQNREVGGMHLDRDDLGMVGDTIQVGEGEPIQIKVNREVVTIRGYAPGEYIVNVHMFTKRAADPTKVKVEVIKINPYSVVTDTLVTLERNKQEETVVRFIILPDGSVGEKSNLPRRLTTDYAMGIRE